jgi:hypothetical protein
MSKDEKMLYGVIALLIIIMLFGWRFIAPAFASGGEGSSAEPFTPGGFNVPTITAPNINITLPPLEYERITSPVKSAPSCGCITGSTIGEDYATLPVYQPLKPVERYEPKPANISIPLLTPPARKSYYVTGKQSAGRVSGTGAYQYHLSVFEIETALDPRSGAPYETARKGLDWVGTVQLANLPTGQFDLQNNRQFFGYAGSSAKSGVPTAIPSLMLRAGRGSNIAHVIVDPMIGMYFGGF